MKTISIKDYQNTISSSNFKLEFPYFEPEKNNLDKDFLLTTFASLKGCCSKVPQYKLQEYLKEIGDGTIGKETPDCSVYKVNEEYSQISTCDFFYPLISDPYLQGKIAAANVLSDIYAMGVDKVDNIIMVLGISKAMKEVERETITKLIIKGFNDTCELADTKVTGGQSVMNPWPMIGGTAISSVKTNTIVFPNKIEKNDVLILTKPLGTQIVVNITESLFKKTELYEEAKNKLGFNEEIIHEMYNKGVDSMLRLNRNAARLMSKYNAHGGTDITGFGLLGHSRNLVEAQKSNFEFVIEKVPIIRYTDLVDEYIKCFDLLKGLSAETSGGLLISFDKESGYKFIEEMRACGEDAWIIGYVKESDKYKKVSFKENIEKIIV